MDLSNIHIQIKSSLNTLQEKSSDLFLIEFQNDQRNLPVVLQLLELRDPATQFFLLNCLIQCIKKVSFDKDYVFNVLLRFSPSKVVLKAWYHYFVASNYHRVDELLGSLPQRELIILMYNFSENGNTRFKDIMIELVVNGLQQGLKSHISPKDLLDLLLSILINQKIEFEKRKSLFLELLAAFDVDYMEILAEIMMEFIKDGIDFELFYNTFLCDAMRKKLSEAFNGKL
jgi:hypothetical protein